MVKKTTLILFIFLLLASVGLAASNENYLGLKVSDFALALKDFDSFAPTSGSIEFTKISGTGDIAPLYLLAPAMQAGWDVSLDEVGIKNSALLIFCNTEKGTSVLALAEKVKDHLELTWYYKEKSIKRLFENIEAAEKQFGHQFIGAINPAKHPVQWGSSSPYSSYFSPPNVSYAFRLYEKHSSHLRLQGTEYGWNAMMSSMVGNGMPSTLMANTLKAGSLVNVVAYGAPKTENGNIIFVIHVDEKNELIYYTYYAQTPHIDVLSFSALQSRMKIAILPEKAVNSPIIF